MHRPVELADGMYEASSVTVDAVEVDVDGPPAKRPHECGERDAVAKLTAQMRAVQLENDRAVRALQAVEDRLRVTEARTAGPSLAEPGRGGATRRIRMKPPEVGTVPGSSALASSVLRCCQSARARRAIHRPERASERRRDGSRDSSEAVDPPVSHRHA